MESTNHSKSSSGEQGVGGMEGDIDGVLYCGEGELDGWIVGILVEKEGEMLGRGCQQ